MRADHDFEADPKSPRPLLRSYKSSGTREHDESFGWQETDPGMKADIDGSDRHHVS